MTDLGRFQHPRFARLYERISAESERRGTAEHRDRLLAGLSGRVIELGAGNGLNFAHYLDTVVRVLGVEPEDRLRALAEHAASGVAVPVEVIPGHAENLPVRPGSCDGAVVSLVLCSVPDPAAALGELRRVLRPGGQLRFFEHVRSPGRLRALAQDAITPVWARVGGGCHLNRDSGATIAAAGFVIESLERVVYAPLRWSLPMTHILGRAHLDRS